MFKMILQMFENILLPAILTRNNRTLVGNHANPYSLAIALAALQKGGILTEGNASCQSCESS